MDFAIQKAVELGVAAITPVITERTVVNLKHDRKEKKTTTLEGDCHQCLRAIWQKHPARNK